MSKPVWWIDEKGNPIEYASISAFQEALGISYKTALDWQKIGYKKVMERQASGHVRKTTIIAARLKPELPKPVKVNENCIVRVRHAELDRMLNYLAKTSHTTYQAAFEEFVIYIHDGYQWGQESHSILKQRLIERHNGHENGNGEAYEYRERNPVAAPEPRSRVQELLEPYIVELEGEVESLKAWKARMLKRLQSITNEGE